MSVGLDALAAEPERQSLAESGIVSNETSGRQHLLRSDSPTAMLYVSQELAYLGGFTGSDWREGSV